MTLTFPVLPMKAAMGTLPAAADGWAYEIKWDGYRTLIFVDGPNVRLQSASGKDVTHRWPEFSDLAGSINASTAILDAELVVFDDHGRPDFGLVQQSGFGTAREAVLHVFDVLSIDRTDTIGLAYLDRRRLLEALVEPGNNWLIPAHRVGDGTALLAATAAQHLEGVIAKRVDSVYRPGTRAKDWIKIKNRMVVELVVGGYTEGTGHRAGTFGALLLGRPDGNALAFAGGVGTGFTHDALDSIAAQLRAIETESSPFATLPPAKHRQRAHWIEPTLTAVVEIAEFTNDGLVRHASFISLSDMAG
ncbi:non-homologous end-joining DNA ligase [uncultured Ilumatobacter sp.]|uniref:non-homologous end-joining DNA ligase n=1 Tax=uncultured Ilumatobacter sp. TaxID=879968 RepID=UPI00374E5CAF